MSGIAYRLESSSGRLLINDIPPYILQIIRDELKIDGHKKINISTQVARACRLSDIDYTLYAFTFDKDYLKSNRAMKTEVDLLLRSARNIEDETQRALAKSNSQSKRLIHNLKSLSAKISQEVYYIALQGRLISSPKDAATYIEEQIKDRPKDTARALTNILRYSTAQNTEFVAFHKLNGDVGMLKKERHKIHKILMSVFYLFFQDFTDKHITVDVGRSDLDGCFDYDSIHVCIYHIVENAAKYTKNSGNLSVQITQKPYELNIAFDMLSLVIHDDETGKVFDEGFSGKKTIEHSLNGSGIGLFIARRMAEINGGSLSLINGKPQQGDKAYTRNKFILTLPA